MLPARRARRRNKKLPFSVLKGNPMFSSFFFLDVLTF
jgi:hypothetical protein